MANDNVNKCKTCSRCIKTPITGEYFNFDCASSDGHRRIANYVRETDIIPTPVWCKLAACNLWMQIEPQVNWDDIKIGDVYHVPPYNNMKRFNLKVIAKSPGWFSYSRDDKPNIEFMYPTYTAFKVMVKRKCVMPPFKEKDVCLSY